MDGPGLEVFEDLRIGTGDDVGIILARCEGVAGSAEVREVVARDTMAK